MEVDCIDVEYGEETQKVVLILVVMEVDCINMFERQLAAGNCLNPCCDGSRLYILTINMLL